MCGDYSWQCSCKKQPTSQAQKLRPGWWQLKCFLEFSPRIFSGKKSILTDAQYVSDGLLAVKNHQLAAVQTAAFSQRHEKKTSGPRQELLLRKTRCDRPEVDGWLQVGVFQKITGTPKWMVYSFIMEKPLFFEWMIWGYVPIIIGNSQVFWCIQLI